MRQKGDFISSPAHVDEDNSRHVDEDNSRRCMASDQRVRFS